LDPCIFAPVAMVDVVDLRSRTTLAHGGKRMAGRR
jgi:hypothetical protein